jgi:hypothetical protein
MNTIRKYQSLPVAWFRMRLGQLGRVLREVGPLYVLLFGGFGLFYLFVFLKQVAIGEISGLTFTTGFLVLLTGLQLSRKDAAFLKLLPGNLGYLLRNLDYLALGLPLTFTLIIGLFHSMESSWPALVLHILAPWIIATIPALSGVNSFQNRTRRVREFLQAYAFIPYLKDSFEWQAGWRTYGGLFVFLNFLVIAFGWQQPGVGPVCVFLMGATASGFYTRAEDQWMLQHQIKSDAGTFLRSKILTAIRLFLLSSLPALFCSLLYYPRYSWLFLIVIAAVTLLFAVAIVMKYARYHPGADLSHNGVFIALTAASCIIAFLLPVSFLILGRYWPEAKRRVDQFHSKPITSTAQS